MPFRSSRRAGCQRSPPASPFTCSIALGLWLALERAELTPAQRRNAWLGVMIPFTLWLALIWGSAVNGMFRGGFAPFPLLPFAIFLPVIIGYADCAAVEADGAGARRDAGELADRAAGLSRAWQRLPDRLGRRLVPGVFALPAGIGDVTTGLLAVPVAILLTAGGLGRRKAAVAWNIFGLLDFTIAASIG